MRLTDMLQTETPRPCLGDAPFTEFTSLCPNPVVIDATDVYALFMQMTMNSEYDKTEKQREEVSAFEDALGTAGWQMAQFFQFDFRNIGCVAPPFDNFVIEFDLHEATKSAMTANGMDIKPADLVGLGQYAAAFCILDQQVWNEKVSRGAAAFARNFVTGPTLREMDDLNFRWIYCITTYRKPVGKGIQGPCATWLIPVDHDGNLYMAENNLTDGRETVLAAAALGPQPRYNDEEERRLCDHYAITQGWQVVLPALLALSFLHTPKTTKDREGYHDLVEAPEPNARMARKYLQRNFVPLVKWHTLDISPLRRAVREAHGGGFPTDWKGLAKALHTVRGHTATYMPNTYFGKKHDRPITVFRPSYRRGDVKAGVVSKEYRLDSGEAS